MKKNIIIVLLVILISLICGLPHLVGYYFNGKNYAPQTTFRVPTITNDETFVYVARTKQIIRGDGLPHDIYLFEYRKYLLSPFIAETIPSYIMAFFSFIFGSVENAFVAADFIVPPLIFLLVFYIIRHIGGNYEIAILCGLATVFVRDFFLYIPYVLPLIKYLFFPKIIENIEITRSFHPQTTIPLFFLTIYFISQALGKYNLKYIFFAGIFLGLNFYNYLFYWATLFFGLFILLVVNIKNKANVVAILRIIFIGLIISIPYFYVMYRFNQTVYARDLFFRSSDGHLTFPYMPTMRFLILSLIFLILFRRDFIVVFLNSFILAAALAPDLSYFVFKTHLEPIHWLRRVILPLSSLTYFIICYKYVFIKINRRWYGALVIMLSAMFILHGVIAQSLTAWKYNQIQRYNNGEKGLLGFFRKIPPDSVITTKLSLENLAIPGVTGHYSYAPYATMTIASNDELIERNVILYSFFYHGEDLLNKYDSKIFIATYGELNLPYTKMKQQSFKKTLRAKIDNIKKFKAKYRINYLLTRNNEKITSSYFKTEKVYFNDRYAVYKIMEL